MSESNEKQPNDSTKTDNGAGVDWRPMPCSHKKVSAFRKIYLYRNIHTGDEREFEGDWYHADWRLVDVGSVLRHR